jgi:hypothetical protein
MIRAFVLAAMTIPALPIVSVAQTPGPVAIVDPPDTEYSTGWLPNDPEVERGLPTVERHRAFLPERVDLSSRMPPVGDQGGLGSCSAWATAYAARSYYTETLEHRDIKEPTNLPSPNYVFHLARGGGRVCQGSSFDDVVKVLRRGALSLAEYAYSDACVPPAPPQLVARAHDFRVRGLNRVDTSRPDDAKGQLARSTPVIIAFYASTAFINFRGTATFTEAAIPRNEKKGGWHAMTLVGYDERRQAFRLINSWSPRWGDHGYAWISYDLLRTHIRGAYTLDIGPVTPRPSPPPSPPPGPTPPPSPPPGPTPPPSPPPGPVPPPSPPPGPVPPPSPPPGPVPPQPILHLADLRTLACAHVNVEARGDQTVLSGYVASDDDLNRVRSIAASVPNTVVGNVIVAPWPQCEALQTLQKPLLIADRPTIDIGPNTDLHSGDLLKIQIRSPAQISYLYVSYIQADGSVLHLVQPNALVPQPTLPRQTLEFGSGTDGQPKFTVSPPFGREMIIAIASRSPLFDHELAAQQTERDYLSDLRRALLYKPDPSMPDRELAATITTLKTSAR